MNSKEPEMIIYRTEDGITKVEVQAPNEMVWMTQAQIVDLFQSSKANISEHISHIFEEGELDEKAAVRSLRTTAADGKTYSMKHYNLDVIISIGYRVRSLRGTQFRMWATERLKEYIVKGFAINDDLLKQADGGNYWKELLERIRDIRSSEKVFYRQLLDLFATSVDYDPKSEICKEFFQIVQNKMHFAVGKQTAAEVIFGRANAELPFMGLRNFPGKQPHKDDVLNAKNYLDEKDLAGLNRMVSAFFELAELHVLNHEHMYMKDWLPYPPATSDGYSILLDYNAVNGLPSLENFPVPFMGFGISPLLDTNWQYACCATEITQSMYSMKIQSYQLNSFSSIAYAQNSPYVRWMIRSLNCYFQPNVIEYY